MAKTPILLSGPDVRELEKRAIARALDSGWTAPLGPEVDAFEDEVAAYCDRECAVALSSSTAALRLGLFALGVIPGDIVPTSTLAFAAAANAVTYVGAKPFFVDSGASGNMNPQLLDKALTQIIRRGDDVGAVVPVDLSGKITNYPAIQEVVNEYSEAVGHQIPVLADAVESLGTFLDGRPPGSFGEAAIDSFNGNKVITTSGGGHAHDGR